MSDFPEIDPRLPKPGELPADISTMSREALVFQLGVVRGTLARVRGAALDVVRLNHPLTDKAQWERAVARLRDAAEDRP